MASISCSRPSAQTALCSVNSQMRQTINTSRACFFDTWNHHNIAKHDRCSILATSCWVCRIIGKQLSEWENADELIQFMSPEPMEQELIALQAELYELKKSIYATSKNDYSMFSSVGQSAAYQRVCDLLKKAAGAKVSILLQGETGVGKEAFARGVHELSQVKNMLCCGHCAAIPPN